MQLVDCVKLQTIHLYDFQDKFSKPGNTDNLTVLQGQVKEVQGVMSQNIEAVIQRGERLDDLMDKTDELEAAVSGLTCFSKKTRLNFAVVLCLQKRESFLYFYCVACIGRLQLGSLVCHSVCLSFTH